MKDIDVYTYYPSGIIDALSKLGGLLAILNVSILIDFLHKRWFDKQMNEKIAKN